jgi:hypothetical protein
MYFFVLFYVFLCCSMDCLFCVVLCIVCVYMCTELLPPGGYPIAVKYTIPYHTMKLTSEYPIPRLESKLVPHEHEGKPITAVLPRSALHKDI